MPQTIQPLPQHHTGGDSQMSPTARALAWAMFAGVGLFARLWILGLWIFSYLLGDAYDTWIVPAIGFFLLPWTTLVYALMWAIYSDGVHGWEWIAVVIAFVVDITFWAWLRASLRD